MVDADYVKEIDEEIIDIKADVEKLSEDIKLLKRESKMVVRN